MAKNLVIVESPAKAKTIEGYLGNQFIVKSSYGHVRDLAKKGLSVDISNNFSPVYEVTPDKKTLVADLKKHVKAAEIIWLATDEDREGEAISWHLYETLGLKDENTRRITFNEITKSAILKAIENPRKVNKELVDAQQARRILDRIVGFELSPVLWKKVKPGLSAGRVQSVAVKLIVDKEDEIDAFNSAGFFRVLGQFKALNGNFRAELNKNLTTIDEANALLQQCVTTNFFVESTQKKPATKSPSAPFTTSTLQQEASLKLGFSVTKTMSVAQRLYEAGWITYMRTDSMNLSETAMTAAKDQIIKNYGEKYWNLTKYTTKSAGAQEAHEAIRPTDFSNSEYSGESDEKRLYDLIWKRAIASQMAHAQLERTTIILGGLNTGHHFQAKGEVILFDGFLKVYLASNVDEIEEEESDLLPLVKDLEKLEAQEIKATERFTRPPARYAEASLVKKLEELGIGRPSTYAPTITTIQNRGYVEKKENEGQLRKYVELSLANGEITTTDKTETTGKERNRLSPTDIGVLVTRFLSENFEKVLDYNFTAQVEAKFDEIAMGNIKWTQMLNEFYSPFHLTVENTLENSARVTGERALGTHPTNGRKVIVRMGKYGPMAQIGDEELDGEKPVFASLLKNQSIHTITIDEVLELYKLPRVLGVYEDVDVKANIGRFGPYVQQAKLFVSIPKEEDPMTITLERAIELIVTKKEEDANRLVKSFEAREDVTLLNGKYGVYLKIGKLNYKLPKDCDTQTITLEECLIIAENQPQKSKTKKTFKKK